jgi:outer membrane murein-binding lipoprotein Lpp
VPVAADWCPESRIVLLNSYLAFGAAVCFAILLLLAGGAVLVLRKRENRRGTSIRHLLDLADRMEMDLKTCRSGLQQAHAVMSLNPDLPASSENDARHAVDAGLRALLQQRLWIRDRSAGASQQELDEAATSMSDTRDRLQPLLQALAQAQTDLDSAMREQILRESDT